VVGAVIELLALLNADRTVPDCAATRNTYAVPGVRDSIVANALAVGDIQYCHVVPPSDDRCMAYVNWSMDTPPVTDGGFQDNSTRVPVMLATAPVGAPGVPRGVTAVVFAEKLLMPLELWAATRKMYAVPLLRPVTAADADDVTPLATPVHDTPLLLEYWTTCPVIVTPVAAVFTHASDTVASPATALKKMGVGTDDGVGVEPPPEE